jgi:hypothetical protein
MVKLTRILAPAVLLVSAGVFADQPRSSFETSDRCFACHNGMKSANGSDLSIGIDWRSSLMANSSRDPYWQASVRRESMDHPAATAAIENECSSCHMPIVELDAKSRGEQAHVFSHLPLRGDRSVDASSAADGVSCTVCHQIQADTLGQPDSFNGNVVINSADAAGVHHEFGPFDIDTRLMSVMHSSTGGFQPERGDQIRAAQLCATCHTLITHALSQDGREIGSLPEQVPYQEWLHSDYKEQRTCQSCHMPAVEADTPIARILSQPRSGLARHQFVAANFFMQHVLERYHDELAVAAPASELAAAADNTIQYLQTQAARVTLSEPEMVDGRLRVEVRVENLGGHKLPTAYPSRRVWLHLVMSDRDGRAVFESGALREDGSIEGNDNDADAARYEPHYREIREPQQVQIYESILADTDGHVTTGLLSATGYLKDNRLLPHGFDKNTAAAEIAVHGDARNDPAFTDRGNAIVYSVLPGSAQGPYRVSVQLLYQPVGYRWANNLKGYDAAQTRRFHEEYTALAGASATVLAEARATSKSGE